MPIKVGDRLPDTTFYVLTSEGPKPKSTGEVFKGRKVALFAVPGAYTPTCSNVHLPSFAKNADAFKAKGIDAIAVTAVNDPFVLAHWVKSGGAEGKIEALGDGNAQFAKAVGMDFDASGRGLGTRSKRYAMLVEDGVVKQLNIEEQPGQCTVTSGDEILKLL